MLNQNKELVYFSDIYKLISDKNKNKLKELLELSKYNCKDEDIKKIINGIYIDENKIILNNFDENTYIHFIEFVKKKLREFKKDYNFRNYCERVINSNYKNVKSNNNRIPFIYILILISNYSNDDNIESFINNLDIRKDILNYFFKNIYEYSSNKNIVNKSNSTVNNARNISFYAQTKNNRNYNSNSQTNSIDQSNKNYKFVYNLYVDETGSINPGDYDKVFSVGGYYIKNISLKNWKNETELKLNDLEKKYFTYENSNISNDGTERKVYHRNKINKECRESITRDAFNFLKNNDAKCICIYENNPRDIISTRKYYVDFVSNLVIKTITSIIENESNNININKEKILLNVKIAARTYSDNYENITYKYKDILEFLKHIQKNNIRNITAEWSKKKKYYEDKIRYLEVIDIEPHIKESIEELIIKYGLSSDNIDYQILPLTQAAKESDLVFADYFCNLFYHHDEKNNTDSKLFEEFSNMINCIKYSSFNDDIEFNFDRRDYYSIIDKYLFYKGIFISNDKISEKKKEHAKIYINKILNFIQNDNHKNKERYVIAALKSILEKIEYESNFLKNYKYILKLYDFLTEFIDKTNFHNNEIKKAMFFIINNEKLAVYNHSEDNKNADIVVKENEEYKKIASNNINFKYAVPLFDTLSCIVPWHIYNAEASINRANNYLEEIKNNPDLKIDTAKLYGVLGQSYHIKYYITDDKEELKKAEEAFFNSIKYFEDKYAEICREYSYLKNAAISLKDENKFLKYLNAYLDLYLNKYNKIDINDKDINEKILLFLDKIETNKDYEFFIIRLLKYCNSYGIEKTEKSKQIAELLIKKNIIKENISSLELVDINKEYALLLFYYCNKTEDILIKKCYEYMKIQNGVFNEMRMLSIYIIESIINNKIDNFEKIKEEVKKLISISDYYKQSFSVLLEELNNLSSVHDKNHCILKIREKLYM